MTILDSAAEIVGLDSRRLVLVEPFLQRQVDERGYPGFTAMVMRRGQLVLDCTVGWNDREAGTPLQRDAINRLYSMTKPIISTALMLLFEEGRFQLADPVAKYIPEFGATKVMTELGDLQPQSALRPMTVRDLLCHTSGLVYDFQVDNLELTRQYRDARLMNDPARPLEAVVAELAKIPLAFQPGTRWHYGLGIDVAAHLIQVLSGQHLGDFLQDRLFGPLGMVDTGFGVPESKLDRLATMYGSPDLFGDHTTFVDVVDGFQAGDIGRRDVSNSYPHDMPGTFVRGGIGLFSTASDYLKFAQMLLTGRNEHGELVLGRKTRDLMFSNNLAPELLPYQLAGMPQPGWGFGLGCRVAQNVGQLAFPGSVGEFGWSGAAGTYFWVDPVEEITGVLTTQFMMGLDAPENAFRALVYRAIDD